MIPGVEVAMGGRDWLIPPLTLGQLRRLMPKVRQLTEIDASMGEFQIGVLVEIVAAALQRNYPDATLETVENLLDLGNAGAVLNAVLTGSGLKPRGGPLGEALAVAIPGRVRGRLGIYLRPSRHRLRLQLSRNRCDDAPRFRGARDLLGAIPTTAYPARCISWSRQREADANTAGNFRRGVSLVLPESRPRYWLGPGRARARFCSRRCPRRPTTGVAQLLGAAAQGDSRHLRLADERQRSAGSRRSMYRGANMADMETSVVISAQTDDLQSGMEAASRSVQAATEAMKAQLAGLGAAAQQAQSQIGRAVTQIGSTIGALQTKIASLAGAVGDGVIPNPANTDSGSRRLETSGVGQQRDSGLNAGKTATARSAGGTSVRGAGDDRLQHWRADLQSQLLDERAFFRDFKAEELAFWQEKLALTETGSRARSAVENNVYQLEKQLAVQNERDALAMLDADEKVTDAVYARKKSAIQASAELGRISAKEEIVELQSLLEAKWALDQDYFAKKLVATENDVRARQKLSEEERLAYEKFLTEKQKLDFQAAQNSERAWLSLMQPIQRAFDTSITGMILGTTTLQKAVANITQSIIAEFVNLGVKMVTNWIASELAMTTATEAGAAARTAAEGEGMVAGLAIKAVNAIKSIVTDSAQAFAGIFAFLAPIMGPAAAGPAAAGEAAVMAAAGGIASAAGGWVVPSDQLAMVHQNEMILPANISQGLQGMISGNGGAGAGSGPVVINISAIDSQDVRRFFHSNGSLLVAAVNKAMRNGAALRTA